MKNTILFVFTLFLLTIYSCKKSGIDVDYTILDIHEDMNVQKLIFMNDIVGYACGGKKSEKGVIYKTTDAGNSWTKQYSNISQCVYDIQFVNDTIGYACGENLLLLKTMDGGNHWVVQTPNQPLQGYSGTLHSIYCVDANTVYAAGGANFSVGITYKTYNGGGEWIYNTFDHELRSVWFTNKYTGFYAGYGTVFETNDSAFSFQTLNSKDDFYTSLYFTDSRTAFACGYNGGIYKTTDAGINWEEELKNNNDIARTRHFNDIRFWNTTTGYAVGNTGLIVYTDNSGSDWSAITKLNSDNYYSVCTRGNKVFVTSQGGKIYRLNR